MSNTSPLVSICVAVYNGSKYLRNTLDSINEQKYSNVELIIIDDFSTDNSYDVINNWANGRTGILILRNEKNLGLVKTCNILLNLANGHYMQIFAQDDIMLPNKITDQVKILEENTEYSMVFSDASVINESGSLLHKSYLEYQRISLKEIGTDNLTQQLLRFNFIPAPSVLLSTAVIKGLKGFDEQLQFEDLDMWLRVSIAHKIYFQNDITVLYRSHPASQMNSLKQKIIINESLLNCLEKYRNINVAWDAEINKNIFKYTPQLIKSNHPKARKWAVKRFKYFKDYKTIGYLIIAFLKYPFLKD